MFVHSTSHCNQVHSSLQRDSLRNKLQFATAAEPQRVITAERHIALQSGFLRGLMEFDNLSAKPEEDGGDDPLIINELSHDELVLVLRCMQAVHRQAEEVFESPPVDDPTNVYSHDEIATDTTLDHCSVGDLVTLLRLADFLDASALREVCFRRLAKIARYDCTSAEFSQLLGYPDYYVCGVNPPAGSTLSRQTSLETLPAHILTELGKTLSFTSHERLVNHCPQLEGMFGTELRYASTASKTVLAQQLKLFPDTQTIVVEKIDCDDDNMTWPNVTRLNINASHLVPASATQIVESWLCACPNVQVIRLSLAGVLPIEEDLSFSQLRDILLPLRGLVSLRHLTANFVPSRPEGSLLGLFRDEGEEEGVWLPATLRSFGGDLARLIDDGDRIILQEYRTYYGRNNGILWSAQMRNAEWLASQDFLARRDRFTAPLLASVEPSPAFRTCWGALYCVEKANFLFKAVRRHGLRAVIDVCRRDRVVRHSIVALAQRMYAYKVDFPPSLTAICDDPMFSWMFVARTEMHLQRGDVAYDYVYKGRLQRSNVPLHAWKAHATARHEIRRIYTATFDALAPAERDACLHEADSRGMTLLMLLTSSCFSFDTALLRKFATAPEVDVDGNTALHHLCMSTDSWSGGDFLFLVTTLATSPPPHLHQPNKDGHTPFKMLFGTRRRPAFERSMCKLLGLEHAVDDLGTLEWLLYQPCLLFDERVFCCVLLAACRRHNVEDMCRWRNANGDNILHRFVYGLQRQRSECVVGRVATMMQLRGLNKLAHQPNNAGLTPCELLEEVWWLDKEQEELQNTCIVRLSCGAPPPSHGYHPTISQTLCDLPTMDAVTKKERIDACFALVCEDD